MSNPQTRRAMLVRTALSAIVIAVCLLRPGPGTHAAPGELDLTFAGFGAGGSVVAEGGDEHAIAMLRQPDGRIVVVAYNETVIVLRRFLSDGRPDLSFFNLSTARLHHPLFNVEATSAALQADGKILVGGWIDTSPSDFMVARIAPDSGLDKSFGVGGFVTTDFRGDTDIVTSILVQPDGKIVAAGRALIDGDYDFAVARYNVNGAPDTTFGSGGKTSVGFGSDDYGEDIVLQDDGKLVMVGTKMAVFDMDFAIARFTVNGLLDNSFNLTGKVTTGFGVTLETANAVAIQSDGKIVVAGDDENRVRVARYHSNGALDDTFDGDGKLSIDSLDGAIRDVLVQPDGKIVLIGRHRSRDENTLFAVYRLNPSGSLDPTFNSDGRAYLDLGGYDSVSAGALSPDGRIMAVGASSRRLAMVQLWQDGSLDSGGRQVLGWDEPGFPPGSSATAYAMAVQPDGKIVMAGEVVNSALTESDTALARFHPDGRPDASFGINGRVTFGFGVYNGASAVVLQPNGKIVAAGYFRTGSTVNFMVARFDSDGAPDNTFGLAGQNLIDFAGGDDRARGMAIAPDGKIVVVGDAGNGSQTAFGVARLDTTGALDATFGQGGKQLVAFDPAVAHSATSLVVLPDGKMVVAGAVAGNFTIVGLTNTGSVDPSFGLSGWTFTDMGGPSRINAIVRIPTSGLIVAAGTRQIGTDRDFALAQYLPNRRQASCTAVPCSTWLDGTNTVSWGTSDAANALAVRSAGTIVVAGCAGTRFAWAELNLNTAAPRRPPALPAPLPPRGIVDFVGSGECANAVAALGTNQILLGGKQVLDSGADTNFALARVETSFIAPTAWPTTIASATSPVPATSSPTASAADTATRTPTVTPSATGTGMSQPTTSPAPTASPTGSTVASPTLTVEPSTTTTVEAIGTQPASPTASATLDPNQATAHPGTTGTPSRPPTVVPSFHSFLPWTRKP